jgi:hypothetical protein
MPGRYVVLQCETMARNGAAGLKGLQAVNRPRLDAQRYMLSARDGREGVPVSIPGAKE